MDIENPKRGRGMPMKENQADVAGRGQTETTATPPRHPGYLALSYESWGVSMRKIPGFLYPPPKDNPVWGSPEAEAAIAAARKEWQERRRVTENDGLKDVKDSPPQPKPTPPAVSPAPRRWSSMSLPPARPRRKTFVDLLVELDEEEKRLAERRRQK